MNKIGRGREEMNEIETLRAENDTLRGLLGNSALPCTYCGLPAAEQAKCQYGFPGCSRADDQMLSQHFGDSYRADESEKECLTLRARIAELEAQVAALTPDAERYRWLRQPNPLQRGAHIAVLTREGGWVASVERADCAIDECINAEREKETER